jgi:hypothetical protein
MSQAQLTSTTARWRCVVMPGVNRLDKSNSSLTGGLGQQPGWNTPFSGCTGLCQATPFGLGERLLHSQSCWCCSRPYAPTEVDSPRPQGPRSQWPPRRRPRASPLVGLLLQQASLDRLQRGVRPPRASLLVGLIQQAHPSRLQRRARRQIRHSVER